MTQYINTLTRRTATVHAFSRIHPEVCGQRWRSLYSNSIQAGGSGDRIPAGANFPTCPDRSWGPLSLLDKWYQEISGDKAAEVKERVQLYLYLPVPSRQVTEQPCPFYTLSLRITAAITLLPLYAFMTCTEQIYIKILPLNTANKHSKGNDACHS